MSKGKKTDLQVTVQSQDQWEELLQKEGLIVVDAYSAWCGPCKAIVSTLKRIKNELGDDYLHFATAETDNIDSLSLYRGKSQPTFLFYSSGVLVYVIRGCNCPVILKTITSQLEKEHKVMEGKSERCEFIDEVVGAQPEAKKGEEEDYNVVDEEIEVSKEVSLAIIKPDAVKAGLVEQIIAKVESEGMEILRQEERTLSKEEASEFYRQHEGSEHFEDLVEFMSSGPCMTLIISKGGTGEGVIPQFRDLIGPKDVNKAKEEAPNSIRAVYGTSSVMNAIHACDTSESAARELAFFFPDFVSPTVKTKKTIRPSSRTLALIRPDALSHHKDEILEKINEAGFTIAMAKELTLSQEEAEDFYAEHKEKDFFESLVKNMCSGPVMALCLVREDAVEGWRNLLGPKEIHVAKEEAPDSLRAQFYVEESDMNPLHGSDSQSAAHREIEKIFPVETTVAVIKPETSEESGDEIINRIKEAGFRIVSRKDVGLTKELAGQFYHEHEGKDFYSGLTDYMSSGQSTVLLLEREDAVTGWRALMGPTDPVEAREQAPDSIRAQFGKDICKNAVHGSSNKISAGQVITELFPEVELLPNGRVVVTPKPKSSSEAVSEQQRGSEVPEGETQAGEDTTEDVIDGTGQDVREGETTNDATTESTEQQADGAEPDETPDGTTAYQNATDGRGSANSRTNADGDNQLGTSSSTVTGDAATENVEDLLKENENSKGDAVDTTVADTNPDDSTTVDDDDVNTKQEGSTNDGTNTPTNEVTTEGNATPNNPAPVDTTANEDTVADDARAAEEIPENDTNTPNQNSGDGENETGTPIPVVTPTEKPSKDGITTGEDGITTGEDATKVVTEDVKE